MKIPVRTCAGCGAKRAKSEMIRVGAGGNGVLFVTGKEKVAGRGSYLCPRLECLAFVRRSGALGRRLRQRVDEDLYRQIERAIEARQKVSVG